MKRKIIFDVIFVLTLLSLYYITSTRSTIEIKRSFGLLPDNYESIIFGEAVVDVTNWEEAQNYLLGHLSFDKDQRSQDFETIHESKKTVCFGAARIAKELLKDNDRYETNLYVFKNQDGDWSHMIAIVKDNLTQKYGSLGINAGDCLYPTHKNREEIFKIIRFHFFWKRYSDPEKIIYP